MKLLVLAYGAICYAIFLAVFVYAICFVGNIVVPTSIDLARPWHGIGALLIDLALLTIFAAQHSIMARPAFKARWTRIVPPALERSTYVLLASLALALLFWQWRSWPQIVWSSHSPLLTGALWALFGIGWGIVLSSTFMLNHFDLFGLGQVWAYRRAGATPPADFRTPMLYKFVRHPIYLGFIIAFWATPVMSRGHLLFALATTAYILIGIQLEERDLVGVFGAHYTDYRKRVAMLLPLRR